METVSKEQGDKQRESLHEERLPFIQHLQLIVGQNGVIRDGIFLAQTRLSQCSRRIFASEQVVRFPFAVHVNFPSDIKHGSYAANKQLITNEIESTYLW